MRTLPRKVMRVKTVTNIV